MKSCHRVGRIAQRATLLAATWLLALIAAPVFAQTETCGTDPATSPNHSDNYILGEIAGEGAAMHWNSGMVWKRCAQGRSGADCSGGSNEIRPWNDWMQEFMSRSFAGQDAWWEPVGSYTPDPDTGPVGVDRLQDGTWRMPYRNELASLAAGCDNGPAINRNVFPNTLSSWFWSASAYAYGSDGAWYINFSGGSANGSTRSVAGRVRLVRAGQSFAPLSDAGINAAANSLTPFAPITLASSSGSGTAWGGARISGEGNPQFSLDGGATWVTEAIVKSGDAIQVRLTSGAQGTIRTATLALRSGETTGTTANCGNCGDEATTMQETTATFAVQVFGPETCGVNPEDSPNHSANYILGQIAGEGAAMHWNSGVVWKRCIQGQSGAGCDGGSNEERRWNEWMDEFMPKSFAGQDAWWGPVGGYTPDPATGPVGADRLQDGTWRMPYYHELASLIAGCANNPKINRNVFPNTPGSWFWSASGAADGTYRARYISFFSGTVGIAPRSSVGNVRLVRAGQGFGLLSNPAPRTELAGSLTSFAPIPLASSSGSGTAWGGARISGEGNPQFSLDGGTTWVTEAIVKSGDAIQVRLTAGAQGTTRTATLALRSGETTGTTANCGNCGDEATQMQETTASFVVAVPEWIITTQTAPAATATVTCAPNPVPDNGNTACDFDSASVTTGYHFTHWNVDGTDGDDTRPLALSNITADTTVTAHFSVNQYAVTAGVSGANGSIAPATQSVNHGNPASFIVTPDAGYHANLIGDTCSPIDNGDGTWTAANITADCAVTASFAIDQYTVTASMSGGNGSIAPATQSVNHGGAANFTVTPDAGYHATVSGDTCMPADNGDGTWTATNITADCIVTASFARNAAAPVVVPMNSPWTLGMLIAMLGLLGLGGVRIGRVS